MHREIFVNMPVRDVETTRRFYAGLGFAINESFSDEGCVSVTVGSHIRVMAMTHRRFADFTDRDVADAQRTTEIINCITAVSRDEVDAMVAAAVAHGGAELAASGLSDAEATPDGDLMYGKAFSDPDGHIWEVLHAAAPAGV